MINANELRLGNWLQWNLMPDCAKYFQVTGLYQGSVISINNGSFNVLIDRMHSPIPITPEILLKCGFEETEEKLFIKDIDSGTLFINFYTKKSGISTHLSAFEINIWQLHQLQNLYFTLTGEELKVEL